MPARPFTCGPRSHSRVRSRAQISLQLTTEVEPGAAKRIIVMAEEYAEHSREMERTALSLEGKARLRGQLLGVLVVLAVLGTCLIALDVGYEAFATALGSGTLVALAIVFVLGKVS